MFYLFISILGLVTGSFLSMLSYRLPHGLSLGGRSYCPDCKKTIAWYYNVPLLGYLTLGGKCANCKAKISARYPLIELFSALTFLATFYFWNHQANSWLYIFKQSLGFFALPLFFLLVTCFVLLTITDLEHQILPDQILVVIGVIGAVYTVMLPSPAIFYNFFASVAVFSFFLFLYLVTKGRGMGFGDVKIVGAIALFLPFPDIATWLFLSFLLGSVVGIVLLVAGKLRIGKPLAFGPFLLLGAYLTFFWGDSLLRWYMNLMV